ncbi:uncharacterized protein LOC128803149 [Vidua macroura]|uniref:uncharacterized protein LOC128803149 n=1 Tax=Vidua macroura TaxID=187451 RepID=UPI0023A82CD8|nr:uncharacterized protein LOC128803149 [Vidua macroura]
MVLCWFFLAMLAPLVLALERSPDMVIKEGQSVNLECSKKKSSSTAMYWFMLPSEKNSSLTLLASAVEGGNPAVEKGFESHFKSSKIKGDRITLSIEHAFLNDSGTYYCAEGEHSGDTAQGAEHKLLPAYTGPAFHPVGAVCGRAAWGIECNGTRSELQQRSWEKLDALLLSSADRTQGYICKTQDSLEQLDHLMSCMGQPHTAMLTAQHGCTESPSDLCAQTQCAESTSVSSCLQGCPTALGR